ncbi:unnamed protein product [Mycena citricolor]|uniref:polynucleotide adenylyltransferase n=1 Tax=Mycena citricolor TaxID=2018698 RepID=A0AAD2H8Z8_9AGAR|nr:unnamed protein product [Mycena citricolor]CAK5271786.1 unnamed protein product [Mycena citricolor]
MGFANSRAKGVHFIIRRCQSQSPKKQDNATSSTTPANKSSTSVPKYFRQSHSDASRSVNASMDLHESSSDDFDDANEYFEAADGPYYVQAPSFVPQPLSYRLYPSAAPTGYASASVDTHSLTTSTELRALLQQQNDDPPMNPLGLNEMSGYHALAPHRRISRRHPFVADLSQCLFDFVIQLLPTQEEMSVKEDVRKLLERLIRTIQPDSRLLSFGSTANGFSLRNSDMDLCCLIDTDERLSASNLVTMLSELLERETKFHVKPLPHARIPIIKLTLDPSPGLPLGIACDIGFENRLALENTRLLMCYAMIDPTRVRTLVLFLKVWSKRRKINSPYKGTLSSYGYVLLVLYFLIHVKNPPVLPNLQQMPPLRPISKEDTHVSGYNTWFFDDIDLLRTRWHSENTESVAELLIDFFRYYARDFTYNTGVASIRAGLLTSRYHDSRERNRLCIEDPFESDFNVGRCVSKDGIYTIRGEFMRASRILAGRPERAVIALADLCAERVDEDLVSAPPSFNVQRPPPQTPYSVGSSNGRAKALSGPIVTSASTTASNTTLGPPPPSAHMAPRRSKWTSPPPANASKDAHAQFESNLGHGLELATSSTGARQISETNSESASEGTSEVFTDSASDPGSDVVSVRSFTEGVAIRDDEGPSMRRPSWYSSQHLDVEPIHIVPGRNRGRNHRERPTLPPPAWSNNPVASRRSSSGPPRMSFETPHAVLYQTSPRPSPHSSPQPNIYPSPHAQFPTFLMNSNIIGIGGPPDVFPTNHPPISSREHTPVPAAVPSGPKPPSPTWTRVVSQHSRSSSLVTSTPTPKPHADPVFSQQQQQQTTRVVPSIHPLLSSGYETSVSNSPSPE